jgi:hypothetical protein
MNYRALITIGFLAAVGGVFYLSRLGSGSGEGGGEPRGGGGASRPAAPVEVTEISFPYSTEKREWVESAAAVFQQEHPSGRRCC